MRHFEELEGEEEEMDGEEEGLEGEEMDTEGEGMEGEVTEPQPEAEMGEYDAMGSLEEFVETPMDTDEIDLSKYSIKETGDEYNEDDTQEFDLDEIKNEINSSISQTLHKYFK